MTDVHPTPTAGPPAAVPSALAYESVPQQVALDRTPTGLQWTLPVTPAVRRSYALVKAWRAWDALAVLALLTSIVVATVDWLAGPKPFIGWQLLGLLAAGPVFAIALGAGAYAALVFEARRLRPCLLEVTPDRLTVVRQGHRPQEFERHRVYEVVVRRLPISRYGSLVLNAPLSRLAEVWFAPAAELEPLAAAVRAALGLRLSPADGKSEAA